jgi:hypothetical protein
LVDCFHLHYYLDLFCTKRRSMRLDFSLSYPLDCACLNLQQKEIMKVLDFCSVLFQDVAPLHSDSRGLLERAFLKFYLRGVTTTRLNLFLALFSSWL